jgi:integrase
MDFKRLSWASTTQEKEGARLTKHVKLIDKSAQAVFLFLRDSGMKPYSIRTTMVRLGEFYQWLLDNGHRAGSNQFKLFFKTHANLFKYSYQPKRLAITFAEARERISKITKEPCRLAAMQMLEGGLRSCETETFDGSAVIGKGSKPREVHLSEELASFRYTGNYNQLYYELKKVGLTPHMLRKLCATEFARQEGVTDVDLMEAFGWSSIQTSAVYRQPVVSERRADLFKKAVGK